MDSWTDGWIIFERRTVDGTKDRLRAHSTVHMWCHDQAHEQGQNAPEALKHSLSSSKFDVVPAALLRASAPRVTSSLMYSWRSAES